MDLTTSSQNAMISRLNPDTDEDHLAAHEQLTQKCFREGGESIDELAQDIDKLLDRSSPELPAEVRNSELRFYLMAGMHNDCDGWNTFSTAREV